MISKKYYEEDRKMHITQYSKEVINITIPEIIITIPWTFFILTKKRKHNFEIPTPIV